MNEGPGGTSAIAPTDTKSRRQFLEALNTKEALQWISDGATSIQVTLALQWLTMRVHSTSNNCSDKINESEKN